MYLKNYLNQISDSNNLPVLPEKAIKAYSEDSKKWTNNEFYDEAYAIELLKQPNIQKGEQLLKDSDWSQLPDVLENGRITQVRQSAFKAWRQEVYEAMDSIEVDWDQIISDRP